MQQPPNQSLGVTRYLSIDILRGLAILLMIQIHFVGNLSSREESSAWLFDICSWLGILPAPLFTFVSGLSYGLWLRKQQALGRKDDDITKVTLRRGLFLFGAGIAFNVLIWLPEDTFDWDILTLIGTSLLLLAYARKLPPAILGLICVMVLFISPILRVASDYYAYWEGGDVYVYDFTLEEVAYGFFANGYFPLLPWIVFPFMGFIVGETVFPQPGRRVPSVRWVAVTGWCLTLLPAAVSLLRAYIPAVVGEHYLTGITMYPASTEYVLGTLGLSMLGLLLFRRIIDQNANVTGTGHVLRFFRIFSAYSLTVYVLHHAVHLWPLWVYGSWMQDDADAYWRLAMGTPLALALSVVFTVVCYPALLFLDRHGKYGFEAVMRWICE